jgi:ABC-type multidrug transport system fused ATPase/permease subunit
MYFLHNLLQLIDGHDISKIETKAFRKILAFVEQNPAIFDDLTIRENITYGENSREVSMEEIIEAAVGAKIDSIITQLPQVRSHKRSIDDRLSENALATQP